MPRPPAVQVGVSVADVVRHLTGNEVGLNVNYLMDDAGVPGNSYLKTAQSIKPLGARILRYPGGEKSDNYYFSSAPYAAAAPRAAFCSFPSTDARFFHADGMAKSNVLDFDEFMAVCGQTNASPLLVVAYDAMYSPWTCGPRPTKAQLITHAVEWVRYANVTKKYGVKLWMIGNESWNKDSYNGYTTAAQYALDLVEFADAMRAVDPTIKIIANGGSDWWPVLLGSAAAARTDYLAVSNYLPSAVSSFTAYQNTTGSLNADTDRALAAIRNAAASDRTRIGVIETEFNSIDFVNKAWPEDNNLGHALCSFEMLAEGILKPQLYSACLWNTRWVDNTTKPRHLYDALEPGGGLNATARSLSILGNHLLASMVKAQSSDPTVRCYATYSDSDKRLNVLVLNRNGVERNVNLTVAGYLTAFQFDRWEFKGDSPDDQAPTWSRIAGSRAGLPTGEFTVPPHSVTLLECRP